MYSSNREFRPHKKWRLEKARYLSDLPENFDEIVQGIYLVKEISFKEVSRRLACIKELVKFYSADIKPISLASPAVQTYSPHEQKMMTSLILGQLYWLVDVNPMRQVARGFVYNSHDLLNEGLGLTLETTRVVKGQMIKQYAEALNVIHPYPTYDEAEYDLLEGIDPSRDTLVKLAHSLLVPDFEEETVQRRVSALQQITKPLQEHLVERGLVPEDPYHFAVAHCYFDRQLLEETFAERTCPRGLSEHDEKLYKGFVSLHLVGSRTELNRALREPFPGIYLEDDLNRVRAIVEDAR
jgi:hypothetical protein